MGCLKLENMLFRGTVLFFLAYYHLDVLIHLFFGSLHERQSRACQFKFPTSSWLTKRMNDQSSIIPVIDWSLLHIIINTRSFTFPDSYTIWLREATAESLLCFLQYISSPCSNLNRWTTKWMEMTLITSGTGLIKEEAARESHVSNSATDTSRVAAQLGSTARSIFLFLIRQVLRHSMWLVWQLNVP